MTKICKKCSRVLGESDEDVTATALRHWVDEHHDSDELSDILSKTWVRIDCSGCGQQFHSPLSHGVGRIAAQAYCPDCVEEDKLLGIYAMELEPHEVLACQSDPTETDAWGDAE